MSAETVPAEVFGNLREANVARQAAWCPDQLPDLSFRGNELAGETGEVCNVIKKLERERLGWRGSRDTVEHLAEELADVVICADLAAISAGIDLDAAVVAKFNATSEKVGLPHRLADRTTRPPEPSLADAEAGESEAVAVHPSSGSVWADLELPEPDLTTAYMAGFERGRDAEREKTAAAEARVVQLTLNIEGDKQAAKEADERARTAEHWRDDAEARIRSLEERLATAAEVDKLRAAGWMVAVHNDYRLNGVAHTFWLWTHPNGRWVKGEGRTDAEALEIVVRNALRSPLGPDNAAQDERDRLFTLYENDPVQFDALARDAALKAARLRASLRTLPPQPGVTHGDASQDGGAGR